MKLKFLRDHQPSEWADFLCWFPHSSPIHNQTTVYCTYFRCQNSLSQRPCHRMVLAVPRLHWMVHICFPVMRQRADFAFKLSFKSCVVMIQAQQKHFRNHGISLWKFCLRRRYRTMLFAIAASRSCVIPGLSCSIFMGWLKHVASPHKTRVCGFISLPSSKQLLNILAKNKKKKCMCLKHTHQNNALQLWWTLEAVTLCCSPCETNLWLSPDPCRWSSNQLQKVVALAEKTDWRWRTELSSQAGERGAAKPSACVTNVTSVSGTGTVGVCRELNGSFLFSTNREEKKDVLVNPAWDEAGMPRLQLKFLQAEGFFSTTL